MNRSCSSPSRTTQMYATSGRAAAFVRPVLAGAGSGGDRGRLGGGRGGSREYEVFKI